MNRLFSCDLYYKAILLFVFKECKDNENSYIAEDGSCGALDVMVCEWCR
jgi:hypothetical protein